MPQGTFDPQISCQDGSVASANIFKSVSLFQEDFQDKGSLTPSPNVSVQCATELGLTGQKIVGNEEADCNTHSFNLPKVQVENHILLASVSVPHALSSTAYGITEHHVMTGLATKCEVACSQVVGTKGEVSASRLLAGG